MRWGGDLMCSRILIIDNQPVFRFGLERLLNAESDLEVVGEASSCRQACPLAATLQPDVVILDLELEDATGSEAIVRLREQFPAVRAMVYTDIVDRRLVAEALRFNVRGYVLKRSAPDQLLAATRTVAAGGYYLDPAISSAVLAELNPQPSDPNPPLLSQREHTILKTLSQGKSNKEIAKELFISERTVKFHVSAVMRQLGARNRTHAVMLAEQMGLLTRTQGRSRSSNVIPLGLTSHVAKG